MLRRAASVSRLFILVGVVGVTNTGAPVVANQSSLRFDDRRRGDDVGLVRVGLNWKFNTP